MGSGVAFLDYDGDGDQDLFFVNSSYWPGHEVKPAPTQALYRNDGKGHFEDVTKEAGLDKTFYGQGVAVGDYDNDGDPDLYVTSIGRGYLFRNDGKGHFDDVTAAANAKGPNGWLTGAAFLDIDNDGDLDLFIGNYITWTPEIDKVQGFQLTGIGRAYGPPTSFNGSFCALLRNDGGVFTDISEPAGIQVRTPDLKVPVGKSLGVAPYDVDGDGLVDIAVANDTVQNFFFHNKGHGKFEEIAIRSGVAFDQSGSAPRRHGHRLGCLHERRPAGPGRRQLRQRDDGALCLRPAEVAGLLGPGQPLWPGCSHAAAAEIRPLLLRLRPGRPARPALGQRPPRARDLQGAGQRDLRAARAALLELGQARAYRSYVLVKPENAGPDLFKPIVGRGTAYADIDGDGDLDVVVTINNGPARLFRNDGGNKNHWIRLELTGNGKTSNRDALGAKVELKSGDMVCHRQLFPSKSYLSSVEHTLTFGLGQARPCR